MVQFSLFLLPKYSEYTKIVNCLYSLLFVPDRFFACTAGLPNYRSTAITKIFLRNLKTKGKQEIVTVVNNNCYVVITAYFDCQLLRMYSFSYNIIAIA